MSYSSSSIPADYFVNITPGVISGGPTGVVFNDLMLTTNNRVPIGEIANFANLTAVDTFFGASSQEAAEAAVYFNGYDNSTQKPTNVMFAQYPTADVGAWLRGGSVADLTLTELQAINGALTLTVDGTPHSQTINLSAATSFTNAGQIINNDFALTGPTKASGTGEFGATFTGTASGTTMVATGVTGTIYPGTSLTAAISGTGVTAGTFINSFISGTIGSDGTYGLSASSTASSAAITVTSNQLTMTAVSSGTLAVGEQVTGAGVTTGTYITALGTGTTGGVGVYTTTQVQEVASEAITIVEPVVSYDSLAGAFYAISSTTGTASTIDYATGAAATSLKLTLATGATESQGAIAATPSTFMTGIVASNPNFVNFQTIFDPDAGSGNANKLLFAAWANTQNNKYAYLCEDADITPTESTAATTSLGYILGSTNSGPTVPLYVPAYETYHLAAFAGGYAASINWDAPNGRASLAYKSQAGLTPTVSDETALVNLQANHYNAYAAVSKRGASWEYMFPGSVTGIFSWYDSWLNQVWLNDQVQTALMTLLTSIGSIPFTATGANQLRLTMAGGANPPITTTPQSPVAKALYNGVINVGVALSAEQQQVVYNLVGQTNGASAVQSLQTQGWYLYIPVPTATSRGARIWPGIILLYTDGGSVNQINISSLAVQ